LNTQKKLKFVFKNFNHSSPIGIHGIGKTSFFNILEKLNLAEPAYFIGNIPDETFLYEYQQSWLIEPEKFFGDEGFLEIDPCPDIVLERIRNKTAILLVTIPYESPIQPHRMVKIHEYFKRNNLPNSQVIYLTCCLNGNELYKKYCDNIGEEPQLRLDYMIENYWINSNLANNFLNDNSYITSVKNKTFLMFNRRWAHHPHRTLFLYNIFKRNLFEDFYISFNKTDVDHNSNYSETVSTHHFYNFYFKNTNDLNHEILNQVEQRLPLILDTHDLVTSNLMFDRFDATKNLYDTSLFHVVSETYFNTDIIHLTEKTYKPILYRQPFIMLGPPHILRYLKTLGFKTFSEIFDESYDETTDHTERFYKILDLVESISKLSYSEKLLLVEKCRDVVEYNFNLLIDFKHNPNYVVDLIARLKL